jgi:phage regulator Rha-like protein
MKANMKITLKPEVMTSKQIAELTGKRHDHVLRDIDATLKALDFDAPKTGCARLVESKGRGAIKSRAYELDEDMSLLVVSGYEVNLRWRIIQQWRALKEENQNLKAHIATREITKLEYPPMGAALQTTRALEGKATQHYHYSNEADMVNKIVLGCTAKAYREIHGVTNVRDSVSALELESLAALQRINTSMIELGESYETRKAKLDVFFMKRFNEKLVAQVMLEHA